MAKKRSGFAVPPTGRQARAVGLELVKDPDPKRMSILVPATAPAIRGAGDVDFACPGCRLVLIAGVEPGQIRDVVVRCPACGAHGRVNAPEVQ